MLKGAHLYFRIGEDNWRVMTSPGSCLLNTRQLVTIIQIMECAKDYLSIIEMTLWVLQKSHDTSLHPYIIDTFRKYSCYWKLTNNSARVIQAVWTKVLEFIALTLYPDLFLYST